jgi:hypothetical protein
MCMRKIYGEKTITKRKRNYKREKIRKRKIRKRKILRKRNTKYVEKHGGEKQCEREERNATCNRHKIKE